VKNGLRDSLAMLARVQESLRSGLDRPTRPIDICAVVRHVVEFAGTSFTERLGKRIDISVQLPTLPQVWGVAADLRQMFMNLLLNARDAMPRGGTIRIRGYAARNRVVIKVEDEGTGVPAAIRQQIFDPFFTTKGENGTGIGLALARDLMTRIGGRISVTNRSRGGAIFTLRFLAAEPSTSRALPPTHAADPADLSA
jgi:signal transduction histidine kinase